MNKKLIIFLLINLLIAILLCANLFFKGKEQIPQTISVIKPESNPQVPISNSNSTIVQQPQIVQMPVAPKPIAPQPIVTPVNQLPPKNIMAPTVAKSCVIYGPVGKDNKNILESLLQKANFLQDATIVAKPIYEIYWSLGSNKANAVALFDKQKNGPLQNDKFKLKLDQNNEWIVPIAEITADENNAAIITKELADKANQINAGGKWQYRANENVYFYQFKDSNTIPRDIKEVMSKTLALPSAGC